MKNITLSADEGLIDEAPPHSRCPEHYAER